MKNRICLLLFALFASLVLFTSCDKNNNKANGVEVIYHLEGAEYKSSKENVSLVYGYDTTLTDVKIYPLQEVGNKEISYQGYEFVGWFKTRTGSGTTLDPYVYSDEFDFEHDTVTRDGIDLYAKWKEKTYYFYKLIGQLPDGTEIDLQEYGVQPGDKFNDSYNAAKKSGYTWVSGKYDTEQNKWVSTYLDKNGDEWNKDFTHPGDTEKTVKVYVKLIKGTYSLVSNATELTAAKAKNIYLVKDIDLNGAEFKFGTYTKDFNGNNHKIENFVVKFDSSAFVTYKSESNVILYSLFDSTIGAKIHDVTFDNVKFEINTGNTKTKGIYVSLVTFDADNTTIDNVTFNATYSVVNKPTALSDENIHYNTTSIVYYASDEDALANASNFTNITFTFTQKTN